MTFVQRFGSRLNVHSHYHSCIMEGMFSVQGGELVFHPATITGSDIYAVEERVRKRVVRFFCYHGFLTKDEAEEMLRWHHSGFSLDGSVLIGGNDREGLEQLLRYCARPPFAGSRLRREEGGRLLYIPPKPGLHGKYLLSMTPMELIERLSHLIPPPFKHRHHYHGVLAPNSPLRRSVVKLARSQPKITRTDCSETKEEKEKSSSYTWARLIARIYETFPLICPRCQGNMRIIAFIEEPKTISKLLSCINEPIQPPLPSPARDPPDWDDILDQAIPENNTIIDEFVDDVSQEQDWA